MINYKLQKAHNKSVHLNHNDTTLKQIDEDRFADGFSKLEILGEMVFFEFNLITLTMFAAEN